ncbi:hypothetical protein PoB_002983700 [Plakobranchus ocellatus]|uniref:Uncharacterized protein n=1 Tax=Plakobranchus ocellatus TaxID=259542 RepID=A0AAV4A8Q1_9GAST|nr:hypothetical protein PoB_002983700 [Plakobranchus ocellatus]
MHRTDPYGGNGARFVSLKTIIVGNIVTLRMRLATQTWPTDLMASDRQVCYLITRFLGDFSEFLRLKCLDETASKTPKMRRGLELATSENDSLSIEI